MPKYSLCGRRKKGRGREKSEKGSPNPLPFPPSSQSSAPFDACMLRRLRKYKTRLGFRHCPPSPPLPSLPLPVASCSTLETERNLGTNWLRGCRSPFWFTLLRQGKKIIIMLRTGSAALKVNSSLTRPVSSVFGVFFCKIRIVTKVFYLEGCLYRVQLWLHGSKLVVN